MQKNPMFDVYTIGDIVYNEWDYSLPTLTQGTNNKVTTEIKKFLVNFRKFVPFEIDMKKHIICWWGHS